MLQFMEKKHLNLQNQKKKTIQPQKILSMLIINPIIQKKHLLKYQKSNHKIHKILNFYQKKLFLILQSIKKKKQKNYSSVLSKNHYQKKQKERHITTYQDTTFVKMIFIQDFITFSRQEKQRHIRTENYPIMRSGMELSHQEERLQLIMNVVLVMK